MLTCSKDGYIKVWKVTGTTAVLDKDSSDGLHKTYSQGQKVELMFLNFKNIKGTNIISVGTNDNRVLFFIGDQMNFNQLVLGEKHVIGCLFNLGQRLHDQVLRQRSRHCGLRCDLVQ